jgi:MFS family permease
MLVGATSVVYLMSRGVSLAQIGTMKAMQAGIIMALDVPLGYLADRVGRRWISMLSVFSTAVWLALTAWGPSIAVFFIAEVFNGVALAGLNGAFSATLLETYHKESRQRDFENVLGLYGRAQFGLMACAAAIDAVAGSHTSPAIWWIAAALTLMVVTITPWMLPRELASKRNKPGVSWKADAKMIRDVILSGNGMAWLITSQVVFLLVYQIIIQFWQPLVKNLELHRLEGWMFGATFIAILLAQSLASHHARTIRPLWSILTLGSTGVAVVFALYLFNMTQHWLAMISTLCVVFYALTRAVIALLAIYAPRLTKSSMVNR